MEFGHLSTSTQDALGSNQNLSNDQLKEIGKAVTSDKSEKLGSFLKKFLPDFISDRVVSIKYNTKTTSDAHYQKVAMKLISKANYEIIKSMFPNRSKATLQEKAKELKAGGFMSDSQLLNKQELDELKEIYTAISELDTGSSWYKALTSDELVKDNIPSIEKLNEAGTSKQKYQENKEMLQIVRDLHALSKGLDPKAFATMIKVQGELVKGSLTTDTVNAVKEKLTKVQDAKKERADQAAQQAPVNARKTAQSGLEAPPLPASPNLVANLCALKPDSLTPKFDVRKFEPASQKQLEAIKKSPVGPLIQSEDEDGVIIKGGMASVFDWELVATPTVDLTRQPVKLRGRLLRNLPNNPTAESKKAEPAQKHGSYLGKLPEHVTEDIQQANIVGFETKEGESPKEKSARMGDHIVGLIDASAAEDGIPPPDWATNRTANKAVLVAMSGLSKSFDEPARLRLESAWSASTGSRVLLEDDTTHPRDTTISIENGEIHVRTQKSYVRSGTYEGVTVERHYSIPIDDPTAARYFPDSFKAYKREIR